MKLNFDCIESWPALAWVAKLEHDSNEATIYVGNAVESCAQWCCEAVWDDDFGSGGFDRTDIIAGSGVRVRNNHLIFVSSGSTVDRLVSMRSGSYTYVANSLPAILTIADDRLSVTYPNYHYDLHSIKGGLRDYRREIPTRKGSVRLTYFNNLKWDAKELSEIEKPNSNRRFKNFDEYHDFLLSAMRAIADNGKDSKRLFPYRILTTISTGYDSTTAASLAKLVGCSEALTFSSSRGGEYDSGAKVANYLDIELLEFGRDEYLNHPNVEVPFFAAEGEGEDVIFGAARGNLQQRILMTGYHGDKVWSKDTSLTGEDIVRGDASGLSVTEFRLREGFLHCPVPFWGCRNIAEIIRLSNDQEMHPWNVRGSYNRPICRRIVETAGVPRSLFGNKKAAVAKSFYEKRKFMSQALYEDYCNWISAHRMAWISKGRIPPTRLLDDANYALNRLRSKFFYAFMRWVGGKPIVWRLQQRLSGLNERWQLDRCPPQFLRRYVTAWAVDREMKQYKKNTTFDV